jgi:hypothetical protein
MRFLIHGWEVGEGGELALRLEVGRSAPVASSGCSPTPERRAACAAEPAHLDAADDAIGHPGRVARGQTVRRVEHLQEAVRPYFVVDSHELGDRGAAVAELGAAKLASRRITTPEIVSVGASATSLLQLT